MGNTPPLLGEQVRAAHQKKQNNLRKKEEFEIDLALEQYKAWCQQIDWESIIKKLGADTYRYPYKGMSLDKRELANNPELEKYGKYPRFVDKANKYVSEMCREKYGLKCEYDDIKVTWINLYD